MRDKSLDTPFGVAVSKSVRSTAALDRVGVTYSVHACENDRDAGRNGFLAAEMSERP